MNQKFYLIKEADVLMMEENKTMPQLPDNNRIMAVLFAVDGKTYINDLKVWLQGKCKLLRDVFLA
jgi:hypothetical protein